MTNVNVPRSKQATDPTPRSLNEILAGAPPEAPGIIVIDLGVLADNWRALRDFVAPAQCGAVVKANAYGLGAKEVIPALSNAGCRDFFVATLAEAREARALVADANIFLLDGLLPNTAQAVAKINAWPTISTMDEAREWSAYAKSIAPDKRLPCALNLDTGLNRLGLCPNSINELNATSGILDHLDIKLVMSHMACADDPHHPMNERQREAFDNLRKRLPSAPASLAASDGLMLGADYHYELVRPGYALYGGQAFRGALTPVSRVVSAYARVIQVRSAAPGDTVGYSAIYKLKRNSRIAVMALGYADGIARTASTDTYTGTGPDGATPSVAFSGRTAPIIGRISMDLITADVTDLENPCVARGDWAEIIGPTISIEDAGRDAHTIGYEVLTRLGARFARTYIASLQDKQTTR